MVTNYCFHPTGNYVWDIPIPLLYTSSIVRGVSIIKEFLGLFWQPLSCSIILLLGLLSSSLISFSLKTYKAKPSSKQTNKRFRTSPPNRHTIISFIYYVSLILKIPSPGNTFLLSFWGRHYNIFLVPWEVLPMREIYSFQDSYDTDWFPVKLQRKRQHQ